MSINKVLTYYYRAYNKAGRGQETGRGAINALKGVIKAEQRPVFYEKLKKIALHLICGPLYWPNTFPTGVDQPTAELLYSLVRMARPEIAVEIGTAKGNAAIAIGQALEDNKKGKLYTIDPVEQELVKIAIRKSGLKNRIEYIVDYSYNIIPKLRLSKIDFAFIDGDHSYENVSMDFNLVKNLVPKGGMIVFHDALLFDGPRKVISEIKKTNNFDVVTLPTLTGVNKDNHAVLAINNPEGFMSVGVSICLKT
jgi:predicted O-methyltransferase YrrM